MMLDAEATLASSVIVETPAYIDHVRAAWEPAPRYATDEDIKNIDSHRIDRYHKCVKLVKLSLGQLPRGSLVVCMIGNQAYYVNEKPVVTAPAAAPVPLSIEEEKKSTHASTTTAPPPLPTESKILGMDIIA